jgi:methionyl-tRNA formyltransferase
MDAISTVWFGMRCDFTRAALEGAREAGGLDPVAVVLPRGPKPLGAGWPAPPFDRWLGDVGIAVIEVDRLAGDGLATVLETIRTRGIALGVGACFPWKVPAALRQALPGGVLNIHPSLLPALRGPEPVFHAYRLGLAETGVTVHVMAAGWDRGPVLAQERVAIPDAGRAAAFEAELARRGGRLVAGIAPGWLAGTTAAMPQADTKTSWAPVPSYADRVIPGTLTVAQATRFLAACGPLLARDRTGAIVPVAEPIPRDSARFRDGRNPIVLRCRDGELWLRRDTPAG